MNSGCSHFVHRLVEGRDAGLRQGIRDISDTHADEFALRVLLLEGGNPVRNVGKEVGGL